MSTDDRVTWVNLSPSPNRTGRACVCLVHDGQLLMVRSGGGGWTFPGGGIEALETAAEAAIREAWEEAGARVELLGEGFELVGNSGTTSTCFVARLLTLEPSPEGRPRQWVNPHERPWRDDHQIAPSLRALRKRGLP